MSSKKALYFVSIICAISFKLYWEINKDVEIDPEARLDIMSLIEKFGYSVKLHTLITEDGYIISLHHIVTPNKTNTSSKSILLNHGLGGSARDYVALGPGKSLALLLADEDYDVWLGSYRGTFFSRNHTTLDPDRDAEEFWNFSFHELGKYDLAAMIDYILNQTGETQIFYVGYSQSGAIFLILMSEKPEYASKIKQASLISPAVFLGDSNSLLFSIGTFKFDFFKMLLKKTGQHEIGKDKGKLLNIIKFCGKDVNSIFFFFIKALSYLIQYNLGTVTRDFFPTMLANSPAGCSALQLMHLLQLHKRKAFLSYDYGKEMNLEKYGREEPYEYDLSKATMPIAVYYSKGDLFIVESGVKKLSAKLPNVVKDYYITNEKFNHICFTYSHLAATIVYKPLIEELKKNN